MTFWQFVCAYWLHALAVVGIIAVLFIPKIVRYLKYGVLPWDADWRWDRDHADREDG